MRNLQFVRVPLTAWIVTKTKRSSAERGASDDHSQAAAVKRADLEQELMQKAPVKIKYEPKAIVAIEIGCGFLRYLAAACQESRHQRGGPVGIP